VGGQKYHSVLRIFVGISLPKNIAQMVVCITAGCHLEYIPLKHQSANLPDLRANEIIEMTCISQPELHSSDS